ncbi:hypothetical protein NYF23_00705 [SAR92 clade bacterium H455]|uniref:Uncharacterized protein n=1 Tax=SAR92 clade bacterium H455 TaxID=2974818 RepID=A0ABY5TRN1_9GAMM|nr:hypothetical protein NYF23_00705 [SAR92 clade bacterium H455]
MKKAMENAKASYIKAASMSGLTREARIFKARIAGRSKAHLDKVFIEGAEQSEAFQEACLAALSDGRERPAMPDPQPFQTVQTKTETVYTYVPAEFAKEMYALGSLYQAVSISLNEALKLAQEVADKVSYDIGIEEPFVAVQFLRDELEESLSATEEGESAKTEAKSPESNL